MTIGISECAIRPGNSRRRCASTPPVVHAASQKVTATAATNTSSPALRSSAHRQQSTTPVQTTGPYTPKLLAVLTGNTDATGSTGTPLASTRTGPWRNHPPSRTLGQIFITHGGAQLP